MEAHAAAETEETVETHSAAVTEEATEAKGAAEAQPAHRSRLELVGQDRPGIVREISSALARPGVSVQDLRTVVESAPMSGEPLFRAVAELAPPDEVDVERAVGGATERARGCAGRPCLISNSSSAQGCNT